jgi:hypothetical protein
MKKTKNKDKATHTTRPFAAKLETPKAKTSATPTPERHEEIRVEPMANPDDTAPTSNKVDLRSLAERLVDKIFDAGEPKDGQAQALLFIIQRLAFDDDCDLAEALRKELFCRCPAGDRMILKFADRAKSRYLKAAA